MRKREHVSFNMSRVRSTGSRIERELGKALWSDGIRYRKQYPVDGRPDFAIPRLRIAIFADSSFWHGRDWGAGRKDEFKVRQAFWVSKIERNIARDQEVNDSLQRMGWLVLRFWDDQILRDPAGCVLAVRKAITARSLPSP